MKPVTKQLNRYIPDGSLSKKSDRIDLYKSKQIGYKIWHLTFNILTRDVFASSLNIYFVKGKVWEISRYNPIGLIK